jgi:phosphatidylinositol-3-phosphatase
VSGAPSKTAPIVVIVMENHGYDRIAGNPDAAFLNGFAAGGTLFSNMYAVTHPSLPNYLALTSGSTQGCTNDDCPRRSYGAENIFHQLQSTGGTWRSWQESMPGSCLLDDAGEYVVKHNPAAYFADLFPAACARFDVPYPTAPPDRLADLTFVTPNRCNDMHDCSVATGDAWLRTHVPPLIDRGALVVITFDEDEGAGGGNRVFCAIQGPGVAPGGRDEAAYTHYSVLAGIERHFSLPVLGEAATAPPLPL